MEPYKRHKLVPKLNLQILPDYISSSDDEDDDGEDNEGEEQTDGNGQKKKQVAQTGQDGEVITDEQQ